MFRSAVYKVYAEKVNKIFLKVNDDKRLQTSDEVIANSCGCEY